MMLSPALSRWLIARQGRLVAGYTGSGTWRDTHRWVAPVGW